MEGGSCICRRMRRVIITDQEYGAIKIVEGKEDRLEPKKTENLRMRELAKECGNTGVIFSAPSSSAQSLGSNFVFL